MFVWDVTSEPNVGNLETFETPSSLQISFYDDLPLICLTFSNVVLAFKKYVTYSEYSFSLGRTILTCIQLDKVCLKLLGTDCSCWKVIEPSMTVNLSHILIWFLYIILPQFIVGSQATVRRQRSRKLRIKKFCITAEKFTLWMFL